MGSSPVMAAAASQQRAPQDAPSRRGRVDPLGVVEALAEGLATVPSTPWSPRRTGQEPSYVPATWEEEWEEEVVGFEGLLQAARLARSFSGDGLPPQAPVPAPAPRLAGRDAARLAPVSPGSAWGFKIYEDPPSTPAPAHRAERVPRGAGGGRQPASRWHHNGHGGAGACPCTMAPPHVCDDAPAPMLLASEAVSSDIFARASSGLSPRDPSGAWETILGDWNSENIPPMNGNASVLTPDKPRRGRGREAGAWPSCPGGRTKQAASNARAGAPRKYIVQDVLDATSAGPRSGRLGLACCAMERCCWDEGTSAGACHSQSNRVPVGTLLVL